jgi:hypothetical protein
MAKQKDVVKQIRKATHRKFSSVFDGMIAADNKLFLSLMNGQVLCYGRGSDKQKTPRPAL